MILGILEYQNPGLLVTIYQQVVLQGTVGGYTGEYRQVSGYSTVVGVSSGVSKALLPTIGSYTIPALHSPLYMGMYLHPEQGQYRDTGSNSMVLSPVPTILYLPYHYTRSGYQGTGINRGIYQEYGTSGNTMGSRSHPSRYTVQWGQSPGMVG